MLKNNSHHLHQKVLLSSAVLLVVSSANVPVVGTYELLTNLGSPVIFDKGKQKSAPFQMTIGYGSAAFHDIKDEPSVIYTASDRGPNIDCEDVAKKPIEISDFCGNQEGKIFPYRAFVPSIYKVRLQEKNGKKSVTLLSTIKLKDAKGNDINGLPNDLPERPRDLTKTSTGDKSTDNTEPAYTNQFKPLPYSQNGLDTEAMVRLPNGSFWLAEEYAPSLVRVSPEGRILERVVPNDSGVLNPITGKSMSVCEALKSGTGKTPPATYPIKCALPSILNLRALNRGIESLALSKDGKTLYFSLQSPLSNPSRDAYRKSRNVRLFTAALKADGSFERVMGEYVYVLDPPESFPLDKSTKQNDVRLSEMTVAPDGTLIQLERISRQTKLYAVDIRGATNLLGSKWDNPKTQPSLEQQSDLRSVGIVPVVKRLMFDTEKNYPAATSPGKIEGLAFLSPRRFVMVTDNDFGIVSPITYFYVADRP